MLNLKKIILLCSFLVTSNVVLTSPALPPDPYWGKPITQQPEVSQPKPQQPSQPKSTTQQPQSK